MTDAAAPTTCHRHPGTPAGVACQRCGRPICGACMREAAVGFQCPDCASSGPRPQARFGGAPSRDPRLTSMVLIALNVAVWLAFMVTGREGSRLLDLLGLTPLGRCLVADDPSSYYPDVHGAGTCSAGGGLWGAGQSTGAPWQVLTSAFSHVSITHIGFNMVALWMLGPALEHVLGRARFLAVYLGSALAGSALVMWLSDPTTLTLGASGAIFGLMGAYLVIAMRSGGDVRGALMWLGLNLVFTFLPGTGISWQGHLGGLIGGLLLTAAVVAVPRERRGTLQWLGVAAVVVASVVAIVARMAVLAA